LKRYAFLSVSLSLLLVLTCWTQPQDCQGQDTVQVSPDEKVQHRFQSSGGPVTVTAEIEVSNPQVADPMGYQIVVDAPVGTTVVLPPLVATGTTESSDPTILEQPFADFLLTGIDVSRDIPIDGKTDWRRTLLSLTLESLKSGVCQVPALEVAYQLPGSGSGTQEAGADQKEREVQGTIRIPALGVEVASTLAANETPDDFRDIKTGVITFTDEPAATLSPWIGLAVGAGLVALLVAGYCWRRLKRHPKADRWALQRIAELESSYGDQRIEAVEVYSTLSAVLRDYLQSSRKMPAAALSTEEFLDVLQRSGFKAGVIAAAHTILTQSDASKFAPSLVPSISLDPSPFDQARALVEDSMRLQAESGGNRSGTGLAAVQRSPDLSRKAEA